MGSNTYKGVQLCFNENTHAYDPKYYVESKW